MGVGHRGRGKGVGLLSVEKLLFGRVLCIFIDMI
jgi:hypothetical protein